MLSDVRQERKPDKDGRIFRDKAAADAQLIDSIVIGSQSFSFKEKSNFLVFCTTLNDTYIVPGRTSIREKLYIVKL